MADNSKIRKRRLQRKRSRDYVKQVKARSACKFCKTTKGLTFHHVNGKKRMDVSTAASKGRSIHWLKEEIAKCVILCRLCHNKVEQLKIWAKRNGAAAA